MEKNCWYLVNKKIIAGIWNIYIILSKSCSKHPNNSPQSVKILAVNLSEGV